MNGTRTYLPLADGQDVLPILNRISLLGGLSSAQVDIVLNHLLCATLEADELVFREGDPASEIYIIVSGEIKIVAGVDDTPYELVAYGVGRCFGETAAIGILPHSASAVVTKTARLLVLKTTALHDISHESPELFGRLMMNIAREACRRLHDTKDIFLHYAEAHSHEDPHDEP